MTDTTDHHGDIQALREYLAIRPSSDAYVFLAQLAQARGKPEEVEPLARAALELEPAHGGAYIALGNLHMERGEFDDLPGFGKPIEDLGSQDAPDWWVRRLVERERVTGVLPPALQLRTDDAALDDRLDTMSVESEVRRELEDFNERVHQARYQPLGGPPLITRQRDVESTVAAWRQRRAERAAAARRVAESAPAAGQPRGRGWLRRRRRTG